MDEQGVRLYDESGIKNRTSGKRKKTAEGNQNHLP